MRKIGIIGLGKVGMEYVFALLNSNIDFDELVLIDVAKEALRSRL